MKIRLIILVLSVLLAGVSCEKEKNSQKEFEDVEEVKNKYHIIGEGAYTSKQIPFIETDLSKGEYAYLLEYNGELRAIACDTGDTSNIEIHENEDDIEKTTNIQLYILEGDEWKPDTKWSVDGLAIVNFCHDSNGNLYAHYLDRAGDRTINGSKLYRLNQNGSVDTTILEDKDMTSIRIPPMYNPDIPEGWEVFDSRVDVYSVFMTENDDIAITYLFPPESETPPKLVLYDAYTGVKVSEMDFPGSNLDQFVINNDELICYTTSMATKLVPELQTYDVKTGKLIRRSTFGEGVDWDPLYAVRLNIQLGREEDVYVTTPYGIYGGKLNQKELDLLITADELGYGENDSVMFMNVGWEGDFYLLFGSDGMNMSLCHYTLKNN